MGTRQAVRCNSFIVHLGGGGVKQMIPNFYPMAPGLPEMNHAPGLSRAICRTFILDGGRRSRHHVRVIDELDLIPADEFARLAVVWPQDKED